MDTAAKSAVSVPLTLTSRLKSLLLSGLGRRDNVLGRVILLAGWYSRVKSYPWSLRNIRCNLGGALDSGLCHMLASCLWSVKAVDFLP